MRLMRGDRAGRECSLSAEASCPTVTVFIDTLYPPFLSANKGEGNISSKLAQSRSGLTPVKCSLALRIQAVQLFKIGSICVWAWFNAAWGVWLPVNADRKSTRLNSSHI